MIERVSRQVDTLAENVWVRLGARLSMIALGPALTAILYFGAGWLEARQVATVRAITDIMQSEINTLDKRVIALEATTLRGREDRIAFQGETAATLRELQASIVGLGNAMARVEATLAAQQREIERRAELPAPQKR